MIVAYRDGVGFVTVIINEDGVSFQDGYAYFTSGARDYKIPTDHLMRVN